MSLFRRDVTESPVTRFLGLSMLSAPVIQSTKPHSHSVIASFGSEESQTFYSSRTGSHTPKASEVRKSLTRTLASKVPILNTFVWSHDQAFQFGC